MKVTYDPRWLDQTERDQLSLLIGIANPDRIHVICGRRVRDNEVTNNSLSQSLVDELNSVLPGGLEVVGVARGDRSPISISRSVMGALVPLVVEIGQRTNFFSKSKVVDASPQRIDLVYHFLRLPVSLTVHPDEAREMLTDWFNENVFLTDSVTTEDGSVRHEAKVVVFDWKRRFCGPSPRSISGIFNLVCASTELNSDVPYGLRQSLVRQGISSKNLNREITKAQPLQGITLHIYVDGERVDHWGWMVEKGKVHNIKSRTVGKLFIVAPVIAAVAVSSAVFAVRHFYQNR